MNDDTQNPKIFIAYCPNHSQYGGIAISKNLMIHNYDVILANITNDDVGSELWTVVMNELETCDYCLLVFTIGNTVPIICGEYFEYIINLALESDCTVIPLLMYGVEEDDYADIVKLAHYKKLEDIQPYKISLDNFDQSLDLLWPQVLTVNGQAADQITETRHRQILTEQRQIWNDIPVPTMNELLSEAFLSYGILHYQKEEYYEAVEALNKAMRFNNNYHVIYYWRGSALMHLKDFDNAILDLTKSTQLNSAHASAYLNRAHLYYTIGDWANALFDFDKAIMLKPNKATYYFFRGGLLRKMGDFEKSIDDYRQFLRLNTDINNSMVKTAEQAIQDLQELR